MVDFKFGLKEKRYIMAGATILGGLALLTWTPTPTALGGVANFFFKWSVPAMPILSVKTAVASVLFYASFGLVKNWF